MFDRNEWVVETLPAERPEGQRGDTMIIVESERSARGDVFGGIPLALSLALFAMACGSTSLEPEDGASRAESQQPASAKARPAKRCISLGAQQVLDPCQVPQATAKTFADEPSLAPQPFDAEEEAQERSYARQLCVGIPGEELLPITYQRALLHYRKNHWEEAGALFRDLAKNHSESELSSHAVVLYLDSLNAIAQLDPDRRASCADELTEAVAHFLADHNLTRDDVLRTQLTTLQCGIWWARAGQHVDSGQLAEAAQLYERILSVHGDRCERFNDHHICEARYNAAVTHDAAGNTESAVNAFAQLIDQCEGDGEALADSHQHLVARARFWLAAHFEESGQHIKAASLYETHARRHAGECRAPLALRKAFFIHLRLSKNDEALENAELFEQAYSRRAQYRSVAASVILAAGHVHVRSKAWADAQEHYQSFLKRYGSRAKADEVIRARSLLGQSRINQGAKTQKARGIEDMRAAVALADRDAPVGEQADARLARYEGMLGTKGTGRHAKARLVLLLTAIASARETLGDTAPERALLAPLGMTEQEALDAFFQVPRDEADAVLASCEGR